MKDADDLDALSILAIEDEVTPDRKESEPFSEVRPLLANPRILDQSLAFVFEPINQTGCRARILGTNEPDDLFEI